MDILAHSLYLASWEHLYLIDGGTPAGLPNQLFSRHPWAIILFEQLYCDRNGFLGEQAAAQVMGWTNSKLFCELASNKYGVLIPVSTRHSLPTSQVKTSFQSKFGVSVAEAVAADDVNVDELLFAKTRQELLQPFAETNKLIIYDWSVARLADPIPITLRTVVEDVLGAEVTAVPLALDVFAELPPLYADLFRELQDFEREPLRHLRSGRVSQPEYLKLLSANVTKHREIDMQISVGLDERLVRLMRLRDRFGKRGGWKVVRDFMAAYDRAAPVDELLEIKRALVEKLQYCFKPVASEFGPATVRLTRALAQLQPLVHEATVASEVAEAAVTLRNLLSELVTYFRGDYRRGGKSSA
jgi:hypothetical protein